MYNRYEELYLAGYETAAADIVINLQKSANSDTYELDFIQYHHNNLPIVYDNNYDNFILNKQANTLNLLRSGGSLLAQGGASFGRGLFDTGAGLTKMFLAPFEAGYTGVNHLLKSYRAYRDRARELAPYNNIQNKLVSNLTKTLNTTPNTNPQNIIKPKPTPINITASPPKLNIQNNGAVSTLSNTANLPKDSVIVQALKTPRTIINKGVKVNNAYTPRNPSLPPPVISSRNSFDKPSGVSHSEVKTQDSSSTPENSLKKFFESDTFKEHAPIFIGAPAAIGLAGFGTGYLVGRPSKKI